MLSKFLLFPVVVLVAGTWAVLDSPCAVAESTTFKEVPQKGTALTPDVLNAFKAHIVKFWLPPPRPTNPEEVIVRVRFSLSPDGSLAGPPKVMTTGSTEPYLKARESAVRAIYRAQPFTMLPPEAYAAWKELEITFDPRYMGK